MFVCCFSSTTKVMWHRRHPLRSDYRKLEMRIVGLWRTGPYSPLMIFLLHSLLPLIRPSNAGNQNIPRLQLSHTGQNSHSYMLIWHLLSQRQSKDVGKITKSFLQNKYVCSLSVFPVVICKSSAKSSLWSCFCLFPFSREDISRVKLF